MKKNSCIFYYCLPALIAALAGDATAGIRVGNLSRNYAGTSKNTLAMQQQYYNATVGAQQVAQTQELPIQVANADLAEQIKQGDKNATTDMATLNKCAMIYPDGEFVWDRPTIGRGAGGAPTCVAVVEMRALKSNGALEYTTVARGKLAAGDIINCNISSFPDSDYLPEIMTVEFPADARPTREDVIQVMNQEQKNKAGLKIAAAALAAGIAGNMVGKNEPGNDSLFGTNSDKLKTTAGGILLGGGLMAASTFSGKVAGDTILHAGVNAAAGGVVGNMLASGDSVLRIEKCTLPDGGQTSCLWGTINKTAKDEDGFYNPDSQTILKCDKEDGTAPTTWENCKKQYNYIVTKIGETSFNDFDVKTQNIDAKYSFDETDKTVKQVPMGTFYSAKIAQVEGTIAAAIVDFSDSAFGKKKADWDKWRANNPSATIMQRGNSGTLLGECTVGSAPCALADFKPLYLTADDGDIVDLSNKARLGSTAKGAGVGAAIGGFSGYQGAQSDIEERFVQATRAYNASLENFYCGTGRKFLSFYNDETIIPAMNNQ